MTLEDLWNREIGAALSAVQISDDMRHSIRGAFLCGAAAALNLQSVYRVPLAEVNRQVIEGLGREV